MNPSFTDDDGTTRIYSSSPLPIQNQPIILPANQQLTIIAQQYAPKEDVREWSSGLCACFEDKESCAMAYIFGNCYTQYLLSRYEESFFTCALIYFCPPFALRVQHRNRHKIKGSLVKDCCLTFNCGLCVLCQVKRDMDYVLKQKGHLGF